MPLYRIAGRDVALTPDEVRRSLRAVVPELPQKHAVDIDGRLFPVVQALEVASRVPRAQTFCASSIDSGRSRLPARRRQLKDAGRGSQPSDGVTTFTSGELWRRMNPRPSFAVRDLRAQTAPRAPGVYALYRQGKAVYVGRAVTRGGLRQRPRTHTARRVDLSHSWLACTTVEEAKALENAMKSDWKPPLTKR